MALTGPPVLASHVPVPHVPLTPGQVRRSRVVLHRAAASVRRRRHALARAREAGMTTAEYAVGTLAACAFAGVLYVVVRSGPIKSLVQSVIERALNLAP